MSLYGVCHFFCMAFYFTFFHRILKARQKIPLNSLTWNKMPWKKMKNQVTNCVAASRAKRGSLNIILQSILLLLFYSPILVLPLSTCAYLASNEPLLIICLHVLHFPFTKQLATLFHHSACVSPVCFLRPLSSVIIWCFPVAIEQLI